LTLQYDITRLRDFCQQLSAIVEHQTPSICRRLAELRHQHYGDRGKARFSRDLGVRPSTYDRYERDRVPPARVIALAARLTGTRIEWLLTGEGPREQPLPASSPGDARTIERLQQMLTQRPELAGHIEQYLDLLEQSLTASRGSASGATLDQQDLIPVVGSTAAGMARYWEELELTRDGPDADAQLEQILDAHRQRSIAPCRPTGIPFPAVADRVSLIQCSQPDEHGFLEFLSGTHVRQQHPAAVAWRIDGDSMAPRYLDRDLVITSADQPAVPGHPCVARQAGQIGVNCKLYQPRGDRIALIPVNPQHSVQWIAADQVLWAHRVLFSVRLQ
jgi:transcriptional regulator with XRE-family HTH domain